ncbi:MFS transporter [Flavisolibacter ginsenosidimutans]|uniref:MFS transporter n=1 Tax=Flavisolibacter ginsenosidimutans TaxID=661481 RepID=A0A5B8UN73_9BACT|nr:MFS transporter [Flavisolibacter ginsenosidimutans]QEC57530.1 MFS transporter [Flavisolibacter ginsenosidimutans]
MQTASKKVINAWAMYDWANSSYSLIITSAIFPAYYTAIAPERVSFLGRDFPRSSLASYAISFSFLVIAILSPILSSIADYKGNKKAFMQFFCYLGSAACIALTFLTKENIGFGIICSIIGSIGFCGSIVFYNAYLPEIAAEEDQDRVSAKGFAMGYIGSVLLMVVCLVFIMLNDNMHLGWGAWPARLSFLAVGLWWAGFAQITFRAMPPSIASKQNAEHSIFTNGFYELKKVWGQLQETPTTKRFLRSFFFYNMGVQTVMYLATYFASEEIKLESSQLIITILLIQLVAIAGATLFAKLSKRTSNLFTLGVVIIVWIGVCIGAYAVSQQAKVLKPYTEKITLLEKQKEADPSFKEDADKQIATVREQMAPLQKPISYEFYLIATVVGLVMGGIQSMSRSTYSKLLPPTKDTASYFSFYDVCDKVGTVVGTLSFGYVAEFYGGMGNSVLALMAFFIAGGILLLFVDPKRKSVVAA